MGWCENQRRDSTISEPLGTEFPALSWLSREKLFISFLITSRALISRLNFEVDVVNAVAPRLTPKNQTQLVVKSKVGFSEHVTIRQMNSRDS